VVFSETRCEADQKLHHQPTTSGSPWHLVIAPMAAPMKQMFLTSRAARTIHAGCLVSSAGPRAATSGQENVVFLVVNRVPSISRYISISGFRNHGLE
jgi:hypothetical protein